ncbi:MAG: baeRF3 domain-containing protein [Betaproteobacteria bacterium]
MIDSRYASISELLEERGTPCFSLYQPTDRPFPASQKNPIRYKNLLSTLRESLADSKLKQADELIQPLERLLDDKDLWQHPHDGLAVFSAPGFFRVYRLQRPVPELAIVANSLHVKPLVRMLQTADAYQILALDRDKIELYEGNRDALDRVELAPGVPRTIEDALGTELTEPYSKVTTQRAGTTMHHGHGSKKDDVKRDAERFFRAVDKAVLEQHSKPSGLPLILAALPEHQGLFRQISTNPFLLKDGLDTNPMRMDGEALRRAAWAIVEPRFHERTRALGEEFREAVSKNLGSDRLSEVGTAAVGGRVATLMVEADRHIGGRLDNETGLVKQVDLGNPEVDDVLDDIAVAVLRAKGRVEVVPGAHMPTKSGLAAIFRY